MNRLSLLFLFCVCLAGVARAQAPSLRGVVTDPSGASIAGAQVQVRGAGVTTSTKTDAEGSYVFSTLKPGAYTVRVSAPGFSAVQREKVQVNAPQVLDVPLSLETEAQVVNVQDSVSEVSADPAANGTALTLGQKELETLSDDPDELQQQLQALAGPGAGPDGGLIYIDGFTGGTLPPKASIREVRINSNPFSSEYDRPGFGRIEIFTKPGSETLHGQMFFQFNNQSFNSRSPLLAQSDLPPYKQQFFGVSLRGPVKKGKASFGFDFERRMIDENAFTLATTLDSNLTPQTVNQATVTPRTRMSFTPRIDYSLNPNNTLVLRYQHSQIDSQQDGIGSYALPSRAYNQNSTENTIQATETAILGARAINETRFQFLRTDLSNVAASTDAALIVQGAFESGGATIGTSSTLSNRWELTNATTFTRGTHVWKWGGRLRQEFLTDNSTSNFNGTYAFFGGTGPALDENNQPIPGTSIDLTALERYRRTLLFQQAGYTAAQIRALGGGASQFSVNAGTAMTGLNQFDIGLFFNDDWRLRPNLTLSYGVRYETQTNIHDLADWSPRFGLAWGIGGGNGKQTKTVLRAGFGIFYDRVADTYTLSALRYNGLTQQSYLLQNPDLFPAIPAVSLLQGSSQPQQLQSLYSGLRAPETIQASIGLDRQVNRYFKLSAQFVESRGVHLLRSRNINAPVNGVYPYGDQQVRLLTESNGFSRSHQLFIAPNLNYKKLFLFGFYSLSYGRDDNEGQPANPYDLRAEWGPSSFADVRHRAVLGSSLPLPWRFSVNPFLAVSSGAPYNITTGTDPLLTGFSTARPALLDLSAAQCAGGGLRYEAGFGCFNLTPTPGTAVIGRNSGRGPASVTLNMRLSRTWSFGERGDSGVNQGGFGGPGGGPGGPGGGGPGGGGMRGGGGPPGGGPPPGMFGANSGKRYNLTFSVSAMNVLNHPNYAAPSGDLSSPFFGESRSLAGFGPMGAPSTYNRRVDLQIRFQF